MVDWGRWIPTSSTRARAAFRRGFWRFKGSRASVSVTAALPFTLRWIRRTCGNAHLLSWTPRRPAPPSPSMSLAHSARARILLHGRGLGPLRNVGLKTTPPSRESGNRTQSAQRSRAAVCPRKQLLRQQGRSSVVPPDSVVSAVVPWCRGTVWGTSFPTFQPPGQHSTAARPESHQRDRRGADDDPSSWQFKSRGRYGGWSTRTWGARCGSSSRRTSGSSVGVGMSTDRPPRNGPLLRPSARDSGHRKAEADFLGELVEAPGIELRSGATG